MWLQKLRTLPWGVAMQHRLWITGKLENVIFAHRVGFPCVLRSGAAYDSPRRPTSSIRCCLRSTPTRRPHDRKCLGACQLKACFHKNYFLLHVAICGTRIYGFSLELSWMALKNPRFRPHAGLCGAIDASRTKTDKCYIRTLVKHPWSYS